MDTKTPNQQPERSLHQGVLFELPQSSSPASAPTKPAGGGIPRLRRANRHQVVVRAVALDQLLPEDHQARLVWEYVDGLDFTSLYERILAVEGWAGRRPADPKILMALWLYATLQGVGSARQLDRLCRDHVAYQWICGDVSMNYHTLSDFRTDHAEFLDKLLSESVAVLMHEGLVDLKRVAQDGMRVRASAGAASFRRGATPWFMPRCRSPKIPTVIRILRVPTTVRQWPSGVDEWRPGKQRRYTKSVRRRPSVSTRSLATAVSSSFGCEAC